MSVKTGQIMSTLLIFSIYISCVPKTQEKKRMKCYQNPKRFIEFFQK